MYISVERTSKGDLEIDENVINQQVEYVITTRVKGIKNINVNVGIHSEHSIFILIKLKIMDEEIFKTSFNMNELSKIIEESLVNSLSIRPKSISFAYEH